ncbi:hypothetical protein THIOM_000898 [Candidatus Thiomargarita nelsonii]|uniref:Uncharacterized protein n=1 Tax=Candidatus Thiomargarita nelsonii TaxID=1003181 RepID=A0A176S5I8_9GAMM|nr:hypothetical protein THIOM_000898 [Candidatus Thiomargarita nelsonii]
MAEQKSSSGGGFFKGLVSMAANAFVPGLGVVVAPLVDVVSDVVEGKDIGEALISGAKGVVGEQCPPCAPAMDIAEGLVQGKNPQDVLLRQKISWETFVQNVPLLLMLPEIC